MKTDALSNDAESISKIFKLTGLPKEVKFNKMLKSIIYE